MQIFKLFSHTKNKSRAAARLLFSFYCILYALDDVSDIVVTYTRPGREAHADFEEFFACAIDVCRSILIHWLLMHWLPYRSCLYLFIQHEDAQSLHIKP